MLILKIGMASYMKEDNIILWESGSLEDGERVHLTVTYIEAHFLTKILAIIHTVVPLILL